MTDPSLPGPGARRGLHRLDLPGPALPVTGGRPGGREETMIGPGPAFGSLPTVALDNDRVQVVVVPALGARVISLADRFAAREWLVAGDPPADPSAWAGQDTVFDGEVAFGWDECLPTVGRCADPLDPAAAPLRDHGDQWGRPAEVTAQGEVLVAAWTGGRWPYRFTRRLRLEGPRLVAEYELENRGERELPILWSMHPLLALDPGARVEVEGLASLRVTGAVGVPIGPLPGHVAWPETPSTDGPMIALDVVRERGAGTAIKLYGAWELNGSLDSVSGEGLPGVAAVRQPDGSALELTWYAPIAPNLGLWLDDGGWLAPPATPRTQQALEPTTSPDDDVAGPSPTDVRSWWRRPSASPGRRPSGSARQGSRARSGTRVRGRAAVRHGAVFRGAGPGPRRTPRTTHRAADVSPGDRCDRPPAAAWRNGARGDRGDRWSVRWRVT